MHPVPMDGTDGKVANEPSRVRVSVVEPSGTWTFGLGKNRDVGVLAQARIFFEAQANILQANF